MRVKIFCILLIAKIGTQVHGSTSWDLDGFRAAVEENKGKTIQVALCRLKRVEDAIPAFLGALSTTHPQLVKDFFSMIDSGPREEMLKTLGLATEEATAKAREESAGALAALTSEKQALQASNAALRREIDTLTAQIAEERKMTRVEQDRVEEIVRDRATAGRTADEEKARLGEQIRELQERLKRTEAQLTEYKKMFTDQLGTIAQLDGWGDISETQLRARIKETQRKKKPSSLECDTASLFPRGSSTPTGPLMGTLVDERTAPRSSLLSTLKDKLSGLKSGSENTLQPQVSPVGTSSKPFVPPFVSPIVPSRTVDGTDSLPTSLESAPEGGSGGKGRRKPSLSFDTGEQTTGGITEEDPDA